MKPDCEVIRFAILDQLRAHHPHAKSFLMDRRTLLAHEPQWTTEPQPTSRNLRRLNDEEGVLYDDLRWLRLTDHPLRLEQERIAFGWVSPTDEIGPHMAGRVRDETQADRACGLLQPSNLGRGRCRLRRRFR